MNEVLQWPTLLRWYIVAMFVLHFVVRVLPALLVRHNLLFIIPNHNAVLDKSYIKTLLGVAIGDGIVVTYTGIPIEQILHKISTKA